MNRPACRPDKFARLNPHHPPRREVHNSKNKGKLNERTAVEWQVGQGQQRYY